MYGVVMSRAASSKLIVIGFWSVEELPVVVVSVIVILGFLNIKIGDPSQLTDNVSLNCQFGILWHTGVLNFILNVGVGCLERNVCDVLL